MVGELKPDLVVLDLTLPHERGLEMGKDIQILRKGTLGKRHPNTFGATHGSRGESATTPRPGTPCGELDGRPGKVTPRLSRAGKGGVVEFSMPTLRIPRMPRAEGGTNFAHSLSNS